MDEVPAIRTTPLTRWFRSGFLLRARVAVEGLELRLAAGAALALLGPNGSGKSTSLAMLAGILRPQRGTVRVFGHPPSSRAARRRLSYLPEIEASPPWMRAREVLDLFGVLWGIPRGERRRRVAEGLDRVGLSRAAALRVGGFSKGMQRRLSIARALLPRADLLLLDEPGEGLDTTGLDDLRGLLLEERRRGATLLVAGHLRDEVEGICNEAVGIDGGRRAILGTPGEVLTWMRSSRAPRQPPDHPAAAV